MHPRIIIIYSINGKHVNNLEMHSPTNNRTYMIIVLTSYIPSD